MSINTANAQFPGNFQGSTVIGQAVHYYDSKPKECTHRKILALPKTFLR